ncbi:MAG: chemotaxis protein CheW, partial [Chloroflexota bacterium]
MEVRQTEPAADGADEQEMHLLFELGRYTLALPLAAIQSVERLGRVTAVPFATPWLRGVTTIRGAVVSVVDLGRFAGVERPGHTPAARLLITQAGGLSAGFLVDRVRKLATLSAHPQPAPAVDGPLAEWWRGAHAVDGEV